MLSVLLLKLFATIFMPILGVLFGLVATGVKLVLLAAIVYFLYSLFFKRRKEEERAGA